VEKEDRMGTHKTTGVGLEAKKSGTGGLPSNLARMEDALPTGSAPPSALAPASAFL
jgi:hypothetical protein